MNIDNGNIRPWDSLTTEEKESGRWVKLSEDEFAFAKNIDEEKRVAEFFKDFPPVQPFENRLAELLKESRRTLLGGANEAETAIRVVGI